MKQFKLTWDAPANNGGAAITDYVIQYKVSGDPTWITYADDISTATSGIIFSGTTECNIYEFRVAALNVVGTGNFSSTATKALSFVPSGVSNIQIEQSGEYINATWTAPTDNGGCDVIDYVVQYSGVNDSAWTTIDEGVSTNTYVSASGFISDTYYFRIVPVNVAGQGEIIESSGLIYVQPTTTTTTTTTTAAPSVASLLQIDNGSFTWSGTGTFADPYVTTYLRSGTPSIRGNTPGNWSSSNRPAWQVSGGGIFNYTVTGMDSADDGADHGFYISSDSGATWTLAATLVFTSSSASSVSFAVSDGDIVEQRGGGASYTSDTWVQNPTVWLAVGGTPEVSAPLNSYATTSTEATAYAVTASGVTNETYQWQALITDFNYTEGWQNLPGKTTAAITLQQSDFDSISYDGYGYVYVAIRCVVTHDGGQLTSNTAHHAQWWISHPMSFDVYTPNTYTYPDNSETIDGIAYSVFSSVSGEGVLITAMDMMNMGGGDYSWFTGDDFQFDVELWTGAGTPTEAGADWSVIYSTSSRQFANLSYTIPESTGTKYYRVRTTRPWPLTVTDGSASAARGSFSANGAHLKVGWPA